jgi:hypothetical protein
MSQFQQPSQPPQPQPNGQIVSLFSQARQFADENGGSQAAIQKLIDSGAKCTMPSGRQIPVKDIVEMSQGKTVSQLITQLMQA